jgi:integrase
MTIYGDGKSKKLVISKRYDLAEIAKDLKRDAEAADSVERRALAPRTLAEYAKDWERFKDWCQRSGIDPERASVEAVRLHLGSLQREGLKPNTLRRAYTSISVELRKLDDVTWGPGMRSPAIRAFFKGLGNVGARVERKRAFTAERLDALRELDMGNSLRAIRDRALLLVGFAGAFRRSEIVALDREDVERSEQGLSVLVRKSKTDQEGKGMYKAIFREEDKGMCPVRALVRWLKAARKAGSPIESGPLFRPVLNGRVLDRRLEARAVVRAVKNAIGALGLSPESFSGHSLRAGFITSAAKDGKDIEEIMNQTGHKRMEQVMEYIRHETVFERNAGKGLLRKRSKDDAKR